LNFIQSAFEISTAEKREQEKKSLVNLTDGFKRIIVVKDIVKPHYDDGILVVGLLDFLMQTEWNA
jgi:predicted AAA+ superfamily ATPase